MTPPQPLTRSELLRGSAALGVAALVGGWSGPAAAAVPRRGGTFRVGVSSGSAADLIDGQTINTRADQARLVTAWETLLEYDSSYRLAATGLAEEVTSSSPRTWTIRVRDGIEFSNGKTLGADDVIYSIRRMLDRRLGLPGGLLLTSVDPDGMRKLDRRTVRLTLKRPDVTIPDALAQYPATMVPVGYGPRAVGKARPNVGTGPYVLQSFTPGQRSVHTRNPNYWRGGQPYFDRVVIIDLPDDTARVNALLGGQIDAMTDVPPAQVQVVNRNPRTTVLESPGAAWVPICMRIDRPPFDDVRVRRALRLIVDRPQMIRQALDGHGRVGNDLYALFDPAYDHGIPQRVADVEQARALLKAAGRSDLTLELVTTNAVVGMREGAQVFAEQAKAAGVTVNVRFLDPGAFYANYPKWPFSMAFWGTRNYLAQVAVAGLPTSLFNETRWPDRADRRFVALYEQALGTADRARRTALIHEMQTLEHQSGGYVVWGFNAWLDGHAVEVAGLRKGDRGTLPLNGFGHGYRTIWFG